jgi:hypothetical protein
MRFELCVNGSNELSDPDPAAAEEEEEEDDEDRNLSDIDDDTIEEGSPSTFSRARSPLAACRILPLPAAVMLTPARTASQSKVLLIGLQ